MPQIHATAIVSPEAQLAEDVVLGAYAIIDGPVTLGAGCRVEAHCRLIGPLVAGVGNRFHSTCVIGDDPQHLGYDGSPTRVEIGDHNIFRESVTVHRGMPTNQPPGTGKTVIGHHNFFMACSHVAHDCIVGNHCVFANSAVIGGHSEINDRAFLSGNTAVHQFCRVGQAAMLSGTTAISQDLPPYWIAQGRINEIRGINVVGMRRAGCSREEIQAVRSVYRLIRASGFPVTEALAEVAKTAGELPAFIELATFIQNSKRGIVSGRSSGTDE